MTELHADCGRCFALCCVALGFGASADFAIDKPAGVPCPHLEPADTCSIHAELRPRGFAGCTAFDCLGAGQRVSQVTFGGRHWRTDPAMAPAMFAALPVVRQLHELLWYLADVAGRPECAPLHDRAVAVRVQVDRLAGEAATLPDVDLDATRMLVAPVLEQAAELVRAGLPRVARHRRADLVGARFGGRDLRGADLCGALLLAADLRDTDLRHADLLGADLRDADLRGADLGSTLFVTRSQIGAARGDARTVLPSRIDRPAHWH